MSLRDPSPRTGRDPARRSRLRTLRIRFRPRPPGPAARAARAGRGDWATKRERRGLAALDRRLSAETPQLASMFTIFDQLYRGAELAGLERLPAAPRPPRRWRAAPVAALIALAAVAALCFALSTQVVHSAVRPCVASPATSPATPAGGAVPVHPVSCSRVP